MKKLLFLLVLAILGISAHAQVVNVKNVYACDIQVTFYAADPATCARYNTVSFPVTVPAGAVVPVNLANPATWAGPVPPAGSDYAAKICVVCSATTPPVLYCVPGMVGCPPCFQPHLGPVQVPTSCCPSTTLLQADWICTTAPMQLTIHP